MASISPNSAPSFNLASIMTSTAGVSAAIRFRKASSGAGSTPSAWLRGSEGLRGLETWILGGSSSPGWTSVRASSLFQVFMISGHSSQGSSPSLFTHW
ncbi:hypothetical protein D3C74_407390 [compost metagenome]